MFSLHETYSIFSLLSSSKTSRKCFTLLAIRSEAQTRQQAAGPAPEAGPDQVSTAGNSTQNQDTPALKTGNDRESAADLSAESLGKLNEQIKQQAAGLKVEYERITEQVRQTKESTLQVARKHFNAPVDTIEGSVKSVSGKGVELKEYPGRTFRFSSVSSSMADLTAEVLGRSNRVTETRSLPRAVHKTPRARGGEGRNPAPGAVPSPSLTLSVSPARSTLLSSASEMLTDFWRG
jgi:hypothetical protein